MTAKTLIATPCYGGMLHVGYFRTANELQKDPNIAFLVTEGESLVTRARNNLVATFMQTDCDTIAFIDADIEMKPEDFYRLNAMEGVRGAAVAMKTADRSESLSVFPQVSRETMGTEPFGVDYIGAACLFIDRTVIERLQRAYPERKYLDPIVGEGYALFESEIVSETYLSEDYGFCELCREQGTGILCNPKVIVKHYGSGVWEF